MKNKFVPVIASVFSVLLMAEPLQANFEADFAPPTPGTSTQVVLNQSGTPPLEKQVAGDEVMVYVSEHEDLRNWGSQLALQPGKPNENLERDPWIFCDSLDDPECDLDKPDYGPFASTNLGACLSAEQEDCVARFLVTSNGQRLDTEYVGPVPGAEVFDGEPQMGLFQQGTASLFRAPAAPHSGGNLYVVSARVTSNFDPAIRKFIHTDLYVLINPVSIIQGSGANCAWSFEGSCAKLEDFPADMAFGIEMRVTNQLGGWFLGRMKSPDIQVSKFSAANNLMTISALPVDVARFAYVTKKTSLSPVDRIAVGNVGGTGNLFTDNAALLGNDGFDDSVLGMISHFKTRVNDTATAVTSHWRMRTTSRTAGNACLSNYDEVLGIVSTNSTAYDGFAPQYKNGFIDYRVAGLHYAPDGQTLNLGTYDLVMKSETARCLYGFSKAPVSATVTVTGADGAENVATTVVSERDGWLKLAAYGFTFSEKEIKVRVTQPQTRTLTAFSRTATSLTSKQKSEIKATVTKGASNPKFICTGIRLEGQPQALNTLVRKRAKAACDYAKSLNPKLSTFFQTKTTKAASFNGKVLVVSK